MSHYHVSNVRSSHAYVQYIHTVYICTASTVRHYSTNTHTQTVQHSIITAHIHVDRKCQHWFTISDDDARERSAQPNADNNFSVSLDFRLRPPHVLSICECECAIIAYTNTHAHRRLHDVFIFRTKYPTTVGAICS